jgi:predicted dehydrogenase
VTGVAVVGTGFGCFTHVRALRNAGFDVLALVGRDPHKTAARAKVFDVPRATTVFAEVLAVPGVDAVTIATPPDTHAELALTAIAAGKHVLCEKPFTRDVEEGRRVLDAAERAGVVHLLGTEFRFDTGQALLARAVQGGSIGSPRVATIVLHVPMLAAATSEVPGWWSDAARGGGWLAAHGSQVIDQIRVTLGEFRSVTASVLHVTPRVPPWSADDGFLVHFIMESGAVGTMQSTPSDRGPLLIETRVVGSRGTAWLDGLGTTVNVADAGGTRRLDVPDDLTVMAGASPPREVLQTTYEQMTGLGLDLGPYTRLAEHFLARIRGTRRPSGPEPATFADGVTDLTVLDAMRRSATECRTVEIASRSEPTPNRGGAAT